VDGLEGEDGLGEGQDVKAKEGALGALKYMLNFASSTSFLAPLPPPNLAPFPASIARRRQFPSHYQN
jgi:hypothetical protein